EPGRPGVDEVQLVLGVVVVPNPFGARRVDDDVHAERGDAERLPHFPKPVVVAELVERREPVGHARTLRDGGQVFIPAPPGDGEVMARHGLPQRRGEAVLYVALAGALTSAATIGVGWAAGFARVAERFAHAHWTWIAVAFGGEALAYLGYALAYREVARVEDGRDLKHRGAVALVAAGFAPFA